MNIVIVLTEVGSVIGFQRYKKPLTLERPHLLLLESDDFKFVPLEMQELAFQHVIGIGKPSTRILQAFRTFCKRDEYVSTPFQREDFVLNEHLEQALKTLKEVGDGK